MLPPSSDQQSPYYNTSGEFDYSLYHAKQVEQEAYDHRQSHRTIGHQQPDSSPIPWFESALPLPHGEREKVTPATVKVHDPQQFGHEDLQALAAGRPCREADGCCKVSKKKKKKKRTKKPLYNRHYSPYRPNYDSANEMYTVSATRFLDDPYHLNKSQPYVFPAPPSI